MTTAAAEMLLAGLALYLGVGAVVAVLTAFWGAARLDHAAQGAGLWFRLLIIPGVIGLWPVVILRFLSGRRINAPIEEGDKS